MPINIEETLNSAPFKNIDPEMRSAFLKLAENLEGKSSSESIPVIMSFAAAMPKGRPIPKEERRLMIDAVLSTMPEGEQIKFRNVLKVMETMSQS